MKKTKIVVIEDEPDILENIEYNLSKEGFEVCSALDGEEGQHLVKKEVPDLVLLDLMLPAGRVFTREDLLNHVSSDNAFIIHRNIDVHIRAIRKKLEKHRDLIETIHGVGYRFKDEEA